MGGGWWRRGIDKGREVVNHLQCWLEELAKKYQQQFLYSYCSWCGCGGGGEEMREWGEGGGGDGMTRGEK